MSLQPLSPSELPIFCALWNAIWPNQAREAEEIVRIDAMTPEPALLGRWLGFADREPVAFAECAPLIGGASGRAELSVGVMPAYRGQGRGRALFSVAWDHLAARGAATVLTQTREDDPASTAFALRRGFTEAKRDFESILDLADLDESLARRLVDRCPPDVRISTLRELDSPSFRRDFHDLFEEVRHDVPRTDPPKPIEFDFFEKVILADPALLWEGTLVATHRGRPVAFCGVFRGAQKGRIDQWLTAVRREWRRRGIAQALKARMLLWAGEAGYDTVRTDNDTRNAAMLSINDRLGFRRRPALITFRATIDGENTGR